MRTTLPRLLTVACAGLVVAPIIVGTQSIPAAAATGAPVSLVNEFIGTQDNAARNTTESAYGDTSPGATTPFSTAKIKECQ